MKQFDGLKRTGIFKIDDKDLNGELILDRSKTLLKVYSGDSFSAHAIPEGSITGIFHDRKKVSLLECIAPRHGSGFKSGERYYYADIFPHFIAVGDEHLSASDQNICEIQFVIDDAATLFYDFDAFGSVIDPKPFIKQIANANTSITKRKPTLGPHPQILYFTGKHQIFEAETIIGKISAYHNTRLNTGIASGLRIENKIVISIAFTEALVFEEAIDRLLKVLRFMEIIVGRPQNLLEVNLNLKRSESNTLDVYWCMPPERNSPKEEWEASPGDILLDAVNHPNKFSNVLMNWLTRQDSWHSTRLRFSQSFAKQQRYSIDRMIGSANMFEILPSSALPADVPLSAEIEDARKKSRQLFKCLPLSPERDSILNALGRLGKGSLKQKINHRAKPIIEAVGNKFPDLASVLGGAVNCRNFFVHGGDSQVDYGQHLDAVAFFTNTLEFIFAASDLMEADWDIKDWTSTSTTISHPFAAYRFEYLKQYEKFKELLPKARAVA